MGFKKFQMFSWLVLVFAIALACPSAFSAPKEKDPPIIPPPPGSTPACHSVNIQTTQSSTIYLQAVYPYEYNGTRMVLNLCHPLDDKSDLGKTICEPLINQDAAFPRTLLTKAASDSSESFIQKAKDGTARVLDKIEIGVTVLSPGEFSVGGGIAALLSGALSGKMDTYLKNKANIRSAQNILNMALSCQPGPFPNTDPRSMAAILLGYLATLYHDNWSQIMTPAALAKMKQNAIQPWNPPAAPAPQGIQANNAPMTDLKNAGSASEPISSTSESSTSSPTSVNAGSANLPAVTAPTPH